MGEAVIEPDGTPASPTETTLEALARRWLAETAPTGNSPAEPSEAELLLLRLAPQGRPALCWRTPASDPAVADPGHAETWGPERQIRAGLIRWLCANPKAAALVDPKGLEIRSARITGTLNLDFVSVPFPLSICNCSLAKPMSLAGVRLPQLTLTGSRLRALSAGGARIEGGMYLDLGFACYGQASLMGAEIGGNLECSGGHFGNTTLEGMDGEGTALDGDSIKVKGQLFLDQGFTADGEVCLLGAEIGGDLDCSGGAIKNAVRPELEGSGIALLADRARVGGTIFLDSAFTAEGQIFLIGTEIGGDLDCSGGALKNPARPGIEASGGALTADRAKIEGDVFLDSNFTAEGRVSLIGAAIGGGLECGNGHLKNAAQTGAANAGVALEAQDATVKGGVNLGAGFSAEGAVRLRGATVGGDLNCRGGTFQHLAAPGAGIGRSLVLQGIQGGAPAGLDLSNASARELVDDAAGWPAAGNLSLDGFEYGRIADGPTDAPARLEWLNRQQNFTRQPYRQAAKVMREAGDDRAARRVLFEMEARRRGQEDRTRLAKLWGATLRATIGYGVYPARAMWPMLALTLLGVALFGLGYQRSAMTPTDKEAYATFMKLGSPPASYPRFNPLIYSLENAVPAVKLGQDGDWRPDPAPRLSGRRPEWLSFPSVLRAFRWTEIIAGWILVSLFLAGVSGVVRSG